jgi:hypothetical protein
MPLPLLAAAASEFINPPPRTTNCSWSKHEPAGRALLLSDILAANWWRRTTKFKSSSNYTKTQINGKCEALQIAVAAIQLQQKAYNKFGANPQATISLFVFFVVPPSLPHSLPSFLPLFLSSFLPCCVLLGPGYYYYFAT